MDNQVYAARCALNDAQQAAETIEALFQKLNATERLGPETRVLVKPNLLAKHKPQAAVTTDPLVLAGVLIALRRRGVKSVTVADSPGGPYTPAIMESIYGATGLAAVCRQDGAECYTACQSGEKPAKGRLVQSFTLLKPVLESDFIISLPKLKTHVLTGISGAVKNTFGCVPGMQKAEFHMRFPDRDHFGEMLVDLCETVRPDMYIVDGLLAMEGDGPAGGAPRPVGLLLAGENPHNIDLAICRYFGISPERVPTLKAAAGRGLCTQPFDEALLIGSEDARRPIEDFRPPRSYDGPVNTFDKIPKCLRFLVPPLTKVVAPRPVIRAKKCIGCGKCAEICPEQVITLRDKVAHIDRAGCIRCFCCHEMCPARAIDVKRNRLFQF